MEMTALKEEEVSGGRRNALKLIYLEMTALQAINKLLLQGGMSVKSLTMTVLHCLVNI